MLKTRRALLPAAALLATIWLAALAGCERPSPVPPPAAAQAVMEHVKLGYNNEDMAALCGDFDGSMFGSGFTRERYLAVCQQIRQAMGDWRSEVYLGQEPYGHDKVIYKWRMTFAKGNLKLVLVLNDQDKVTGLWFK